MLLCGPVLLDLAVSGRRGPFTYVAADTFYYLTVARNIARHGLASYDGQHLTNGFHPVWQFVIGALYFCTEHLGLREHAILVAVVASLVLGALGVVLLARSFSESGALSPFFALLPMGAYGLLLAPFWLSRLRVLASESSEGPFPVYGTLWSYANGMESGVVLFAFGLCAFAHRAWHRQPSASRALGLGFAAAFFVLSRLDHIFMALPLVVAFCITARQRPSTERHAIYALLAFGIPVACDMAVNEIVFGAVVPVSGALKLTLPLVTNVHIQSWLDTLTNWQHFNLFVLQREAALVVPVLVAGAYLALTLRLVPFGSTFLLRYRDAARDFERFLVPIAVGVMVFGVHQILFLNDGPGSWHLPISTMFVTLAILAIVTRAPVRLDRRAALGVIGLIACLSVAFFVTFRQPTYHRAFADFYLHDAPVLRQAFAKNPPRLLEFDDGIVSYALDVPAMSMGLMLDPEALDARLGGRLYSLAYERGFNCVSSLYYHPAWQLLHDSSRQAAKRYAREMIPEEVSGFDFDVSYLTASASLAIVCGHKR